SPVVLLDRCGVLDRAALLIHCIRVDADDIRLVAERGCGVAHCPGSNAMLGHGVAPLLEFVAAGVLVGLGTDSMASNEPMDRRGGRREGGPQGRPRPERGLEFRDSRGDPAMASGKGPTARIWRDGTIVDWADATIHVMSHAVHYGSSVFEGIRAYEGPAGGAVF